MSKKPTAVVTTPTENVENSGDAQAPRPKTPYKFKHSWRINMLATPKNLTEKYVEPEYKFDSGVPPETLTAECTERREHMARSGIRYLRVNKKLFTPIVGPEYGKRMDEYIDKSWNSIYNYYRKSLHDLAMRKKARPKISTTASTVSKKSGKGGKAVGKKSSKVSSTKSKEEIMKEFDEWCVERAKPKRLFPPEPVDRGQIADLDAIKERQDERAMPKRVYKRPSQDSAFVDFSKIKKSALTYQPTDRIGVLAQPTVHRMLKEEVIIPGSVKPSALEYKITPRVNGLAVPKQTAALRESDLNEDAFTISPSALKYVATPRILELAKPLERD